MAFYDYLKVNCRQVGVSVNPFSQVTSNRSRGQGFKLHHGWFSLDIRKIFVTDWVVVHWNWLVKEGVKSLSLETLKNHVDVALRDMNSGRTVSVRLMAGLNDLRDLFQL